MSTEIISYFHKKADRYDEVDQQVYWRLSDELLWDTLTTTCLDRLPPDFTFLDAGGGTGRWTQRVLDAYPRSRGVLVDLSPDMLAVAETKRTGDRADRLDLVQGDLGDLPAQVRDRRFDVIWNFHNVIGFVPDPGAVIASLADLLTDTGTLVTLAPNRYHAVYFNLAIGRLEAAREAATTGVSTFTDDMPPLRLFSPDEITELYAAAGCRVDLLTGFPSAVYPSRQETQLDGSSPAVVDLLGDPAIFADVLAIEKQLALEPDLAARGNNIFVAGRRNPA
ncbi:class I SAM-dependent methyltransferase [Umezawaea tangerina]|uniref:class I SAM-dependent methyltransferase n=1 Tax=Umezawaea tangerina TaxID=84725 RepID=UPI001472A32E|nr:class I SAM-dependent methyltransferase [Umezawaea tangerina]